MVQTQPKLNMGQTNLQYEPSIVARPNFYPDYELGRTGPLNPT